MDPLSARRQVAAAAALDLACLPLAALMPVAAGLITSPLGALLGRSAPLCTRGMLDGAAAAAAAARKCWRRQELSGHGGRAWARQQAAKLQSAAEAAGKLTPPLAHPLPSLPAGAPSAPSAPTCHATLTFVQISLGLALPLLLSVYTWRPKLACSDAAAPGALLAGCGAWLPAPAPPQTAGSTACWAAAAALLCASWSSFTCWPTSGFTPGCDQRGRHAAEAA